MIAPRTIWLRTSVLVIALLWLGLLACATAQTAPLTRVSEIRRLSREQAAKALPVKIEGVCVFALLWRNATDFVVHDGERSIWISLHSAKTGILSSDRWNSSTDPLLGAHLEVVGVTDPATYSPAVLPTAIRRLGTLPVPVVRRVPMERLLSGNEDGQMVEVEGVVQSLHPGDHSALLMVEGHLCRIACAPQKPTEPALLEDARVHVRGLFASDSNARSEAALLKIMLSGAPGEVETITPPPPDPFHAPKVTLDHLMPFSPETQPFHRKVIEGVVIFAVPGQFFFLQDEQNSRRVESASREVTVGQRVEVAGFVDVSHSFASLKNALVRRLGLASPPKPKWVTAHELLDETSGAYWGKATSGDFSGRAVVLSGHVDRVEWKEDSEPQTGKVPNALWIKSGGRSFPAFLPLHKSLSTRQADSWIPGAEVELTGICELELPEKGLPRDAYRPIAFHLWLAGPEQVHVVRLPPWWTPLRLTMALSGVAILLAFLSGWTWMLRREVEKQTRIISEKGRIEATNTERARIARDLHDEIGANLTHLSILTTLAARADSDATVSRQHNTEAASVARQTIQAFDEILWSVNPRNDTLQSLCHYVCRITEDILAPAAVTLRFALDESYPAQLLPPQCRHGLILAMKEALHNILKHARATHVDVQCTMDGGAFLVRMADNGRGFDPQALCPGTHARRGSGVENMRQRLAELGGECRIVSAAGNGTQITYRLPLP